MSIYTYAVQVTVNELAMARRYPLRVYLNRAGELDAGYQSRHRTLSGAMRSRERIRKALGVYHRHLIAVQIWEFDEFRNTFDCVYLYD